MAHTKGPWRVSLHGIDINRDDTATRLVYIDVPLANLGTAADDRALIEEAPELLAACKKSWEIARTAKTFCPKILDLLGPVIARAEGGTP
jgi:hypothetical protein